jgi:hypothetical protein
MILSGRRGNELIVFVEDDGKSPGDSIGSTISTRKKLLSFGLSW